MIRAETLTQVAKTDAFNAITDAFQHRIKELFTQLTAEQIERFDEMLVEDRTEWWRIQIGTNPTDAKSINDKLIADSNDLIDMERPGSLEQLASRAVCYDNMIRRNYLCIGTFLEDIEISDSGTVKIGRSWSNEKLPAAFLGSSEKQGPYKGKAAIDVFQSGLSGHMFLTVYAEHERVTLKSFVEEFKKEQETLALVNLSTEKCRLMKTWMRSIIEQAIGKNTTAAWFHEYYRKSSEQFTEALYRSWCGGLVGPGADLAEHQGALLALPGVDTKFLRTIAALGCIGSPIVSSKSIAKCCEQQGLSREDFMPRAHKLQFLLPVGRYWGLTV